MNILEMSEQDLLNKKDYWPYMNNILKLKQFSEDFLSQTVEYYDSWVCIKYQKNLSPYFCFRYLFDNKTDSADNWSDYNDIVNYLSKQEKQYTDEEIDFFYKKALCDREKINI